MINHPASHSLEQWTLHLTDIRLVLFLAALLWGVVGAKAENTSDSVAEANTPIIRVLLNDAPPYRIINKGEASGMYVEMLEAMLTEFGSQIRYEEVPYLRALHMLETGLADIMLGPLKRPEREKYIDFSLPVFPAETKVFLAQEPENLVNSYDDLSRKRIGVLLGAAYFEPFDSDDSLVREESNDYRSLLEMLHRGRVDLVLIPELQGAELARELKIDVLKSPYVIQGEPSYLAISRQSRLVPFIPQMRNAMIRLHQSPQYQQILNKYRHPSGTVRKGDPACVTNADSEDC